MSFSHKKVKQLIAMMNDVSETKIPALKPVIETFEIAMSERTLDFLLAVGIDEHSKEELQQIYQDTFGKQEYEEHFEDTWFEIMDCGFLIAGEKNYQNYMMTPIFPGWLELSTAGPLNEKRKAILNKWSEFWKLLKLINIAPVRYYTNLQIDKDLKEKPAWMSTYVASGKKVITLDQPLTSEQQVRPTGDIYRILEKHKDEIAVMNCICRVHKMLEGGKCDSNMPLDGCMNVGPLTEQLVANGISRKISFEEACDLLYEFEKKGAIHTLYHYHNDSNKDEFNICNCCNDCCLLYASPLKGYLSKVFVHSFYVPKMIDESRCIGCNLCGKKCATGATYYDKKKKNLSLIMMLVLVVVSVLYSVTLM